jgi:hypothetical protein
MGGDYFFGVGGFGRFGNRFYDAENDGEFMQTNLFSLNSVS